MNIEKNNEVLISGYIASDLLFSHELFGESFYLVYVKVQRISGNYDTIPTLISERLVDINQICRGKSVRIEGCFRSHNSNNSKLILRLFAKKVEIIDSATMDNSIKLDGYICKYPTYRTTPNGREITDMILAVNRPYGKSDYIPCICWGRNARFAESLDVGCHIQLIGRIQSRTYLKKLSETETEERTAYEVSISVLEVLNEKDCD